jgi:hypothetical protein
MPPTPPNPPTLVPCSCRRAGKAHPPSADPPQQTHPGESAAPAPRSASETRCHQVFVCLPCSSMMQCAVNTAQQAWGCMYQVWEGSLSTTVGLALPAPVFAFKSSWSSLCDSRTHVQQLSFGEAESLEHLTKVHFRHHVLTVLLLLCSCCVHVGGGARHSQRGQAAAAAAAGGTTAATTSAAAAAGAASTSSRTAVTGWSVAVARKLRAVTCLYAMYLWAHLPQHVLALGWAIGLVLLGNTCWLLVTMRAAMC